MRLRTGSGFMGLLVLGPQFQACGQTSCVGSALSHTLISRVLRPMSPDPGLDFPELRCEALTSTSQRLLIGSLAPSHPKYRALDTRDMQYREVSKAIRVTRVSEMAAESRCQVL